MPEPALEGNSGQRWRRSRDSAEGQGILGYCIDIPRLLEQRLGWTEHEKHLFRVFLMAGADRVEVYRSVEALADAMEAKLRTVSDAVSGLRDKDLLLKTARPRRRLSLPTRWKLGRAKIIELYSRHVLRVSDTIDTQIMRVDSSVDAQHLHVDDESTRKLCASTSPTPLIRKEKVGKDPSPPTSPSDWQSIETALDDAGLDQIDLALATAQERGLSPREVALAIQFAEERRSEFRSLPGAIFWWIDHAKPGAPIHKSWPVNLSRGPLADAPLHNSCPVYQEIDE